MNDSGTVVYANNRSRDPGVFIWDGITGIRVHTGLVLGATPQIDNAGVIAFNAPHQGIGVLRNGILNYVTVHGGAGINRITEFCSLESGILTLSAWIPTVPPDERIEQHVILGVNISSGSSFIQSDSACAPRTSGLVLENNQLFLKGKRLISVGDYAPSMEIVLSITPLQVNALEQALFMIRTTSDVSDWDDVLIVSGPANGGADIIADGIFWNSAGGGMDARYAVREGPLTVDSNAKIFWANGRSRANILSQVPIAIEPIPAGGNRVIAFNVPEASLISPPPGATHVLMIVDGDSQVLESDEYNNIRATPLRADLVAVGLNWNNTLGGLDARYSVEYDGLTTSTTAKLFWANGTSTANILSQTPIHTETIPDGTGGPGGTGILTFHIAGNVLRNAPSGVTHLLLVMDPDGLRDEAKEDNNVVALEDARVRFSNPTRDASRVSTTRTIPAIKDFLRQAGQSVAWITSTARTPEEQGRIMFENRLAKTGAGYGAPGRAVLAVYDRMTANMTRSQILANSNSIIAAMVEEIKNQGPSSVSRHCGDFNVLNVVDIGQQPFSISGQSLFIKAACADPRVSRFLAPYRFQCAEPLEKAPVFHLELPQGISPSPNPIILTSAESQLNRLEEGFLLDDSQVSTNSNHINTSTGFGTGSGTVSTGHQTFTFDANAGDVVSISVNATEIFPGTQFANDDSMLFLFDVSGKLLASNDDEFDGGFGAAIDDFTLLETGKYSAVVTTYSNEPTLNENGIITGWEDDGGANITFDLMLNVISSVPRLFVRSTDRGELVLEWRGTNVLQEANTATGDWNDVFGSSSPTILQLWSPQRFYRLRSP